MNTTSNPIASLNFLSAALFSDGEIKTRKNTHNLYDIPVGAAINANLYELFQLYSDQEIQAFACVPEKNEKYLFKLLQSLVVTKFPCCFLSLLQPISENKEYDEADVILEDTEDPSLVVEIRKNWRCIGSLGGLAISGKALKEVGFLEPRFWYTDITAADYLLRTSEKNLWPGTVWFPYLRLDSPSELIGVFKEGFQLEKEQQFLDHQLWVTKFINNIAWFLKYHSYSFSFVDFFEKTN